MTGLYPHDDIIKAALSAEQVVAMTLWGESRDQTVLGQIAVGCTIRNRLLKPVRFGDTWKAVALARRQYSCWLPDGGPDNYRAVLARCEAGLASETAWPAQALWIAHGLIDNLVTDVVGGSTHYMTTALFRTGTVAWARGLTPTVVIGAHSFFSNVR